MKTFRQKYLRSKHGGPVSTFDIVVWVFSVIAFTLLAIGYVCKFKGWWGGF